MIIDFNIMNTLICKDELKEKRKETIFCPKYTVKTLRVNSKPLKYDKANHETDTLFIYHQKIVQRATVTKTNTHSLFNFRTSIDIL